MTDREVCIVPATSAATRSIRRHFRECKAVSVSLIQPCAAKYVKWRRQLRLRQEGSLLHLLIANGTCSLGAASAEGRRWKDGTSSQSIRLPRCPIPYDCCRFCYRFRLLLAVPGCLCDAPLRSLLLPGPSGSSHLHHILHLKPYPHHPSSSSSPHCPEGNLLCARHRLHLPCHGAAEGRWRHIPCPHHGGVHIHSCLRALSRYGLRPYPRDTQQRLDRLPKI